MRWVRRRSSCSWCYVEGEATGTFPRAVVSLWLRRECEEIWIDPWHQGTSYHSGAVRDSASESARQMWYADREVMLYEPLEKTPDGPATRVFRSAVHVCSGDATSTMKLKRKFHTTAVRSLYCEIDVGPDAPWSEVSRSYVECGGVGDLLAVDGDHAGSAEVLGAMYEKQLKSMGCPHWVRSTEQKSFQSAKGGFSVILRSAWCLPRTVVARSAINRTSPKRPRTTRIFARSIHRVSCTSTI